MARDERDEIVAGISATLVRAAALIPLGQTRIQILVDPRHVIPEVGVGGRTVGTDAGPLIRLYFDLPGGEDRRHIIAQQLPSLLAHELHHASRIRTVGYGSSLPEAIISEGLADHFAQELTGRGPAPWSVALSLTQLAEWTPRALALGSGAYDHDAWFFGAQPGIPRWAGYAIGYALVGRYLAAHPDAHASSRVDEPAATFLAGVS